MGWGGAGWGGGGSNVIRGACRTICIIPTRPSRLILQQEGFASERDLVSNLNMDVYVCGNENVSLYRSRPRCRRNADVGRCRCRCICRCRCTYRCRGGCKCNRKCMSLRKCMPTMMYMHSYTGDHGRCADGRAAGRPAAPQGSKS